MFRGATSGRWEFFHNLLSDIESVKMYKYDVNVNYQKQNQKSKYFRSVFYTLGGKAHVL